MRDRRPRDGNAKPGRAKNAAGTRARAPGDRGRDADGRPKTRKSRPNNISPQEVRRLKRIARFVPYPVGVRLIRWWTARSWVRRRHFAHAIESFERLLAIGGPRPNHAFLVHRFLANNVGRDWRLAALARLQGPDLFRWVEVAGWEHFETALARGRGVVLASHHTTVGQVVSLVMDRKGHAVHTVGNNFLKLRLMSVADPRDPAITRARRRDQTQQMFLEHLQNARQVLLGGGIVQIAPDGGAGRGGTRMAVQGRSWIFREGFAELADMTGAAVIPVFVTIDARERVTVRFHPPLATAAPPAKRPERMRTLMASYVAFFRSMWIGFPEQFRLTAPGRFLALPEEGAEPATSDRRDARPDAKRQGSSRRARGEAADEGKPSRWPAWLMRLLPSRPTHKWERNWSEGTSHRWELGTVSRHFVEAFESGVLKPGDRCLDVGCGLGHSSAWLASRGMRVTGIDVADSAIGEARKLHAATPGLEFRQADVTEPCEGLGSFQAVLDRGCLHILPRERWRHYFENVAAWLEPGGVFLLQHKSSRETLIHLQERLERRLPPGMTLLEARPIDMIEGSAAEGIPGVLFVIRRQPGGR